MQQHSMLETLDSPLAVDKENFGAIKHGNRCHFPGGHHPFQIDHPRMHGPRGACMSVRAPSE